ncbi:MAG: phosphoribosylformylglycinamidine cyclo-ligase [Chromatiales bacterium]|nr:phosphoribosylformylglycinamidine cyclo-ligase [Chromatiales bacterium]
MPNHSYKNASQHYRQAGVDIAAGEMLVAKIKRLSKQTNREGVISGIGGFAGLFDLAAAANYQAPVMLAATDGVGTKLKIAHAMHKHDTIGIDLVAMCVNDILAQGGEPIFFLDYLACGKLHVDTMYTIVQGIVQGCKEANAALIGGETAEMPGCYPQDQYDVAGFAIGLAERNNLLPKTNIKADDIIIGIASSGLHSNGYSVINKLIAEHRIKLNETLDGSTLGALLLKPTTIYVSALLPLIQQGLVTALAHITGGGITSNLPRVLPAHHCALIDKKGWPRPIIFDWLQKECALADEEMLSVYNCGIGMILITTTEHQAAVMHQLELAQLPAWLIGRVKQSKAKSPYVEYSEHR